MPDYFGTDHLIAPPITAGPAPSFWQSLTQGVSQQYHVDSAYALPAEVQTQWEKSLYNYHRATGEDVSMPFDLTTVGDYIKATHGTDPGFWNEAVTRAIGLALPSTQGTYTPFTLSSSPQQSVDQFRKVNDKIKALGRTDIPSMEQIISNVSQMQHQVEEETQRQSETGGVGSTIGRFVGGASGSMSWRDPLNLATLPIGGFGKSVATRIVTEAAIQAGITGVTDVTSVNPNRQSVGLQPHSTMYDMLLAAAGGAVLRGLGEAAHAGFRHFTSETPTPETRVPEISGEAPTNDELRATLDTLSDSPRTRAGRSILDAVDDIERVNPYGDGLQGHARFMEELRRVQDAMNGTADTAIARFLPPLPEVPAEHIESNFDFQLVREQRPELYDRMKATQAAIVDVEQRIADTEAGIASLSPSDAISRIDPESGALIRSYEEDLRDPSLTAEKRADIERRVNTIVQTLGPENVQRELTNATIKPKKELQSLRASRKAAVRRYKDAFNAVQAEAEAIKNRQRIIALANNRKETVTIIAGGGGRAFPPVSIQAAEDIAHTVELADEAMPERVDYIVSSQPKVGYDKANGTFSGSVELVHGTTGKAAPSFVEAEKFKGTRYDEGGNLFGNEAVYLGADKTWFNGSRFGLSFDKHWRVRADFKRAYVLTPDKMEEFLGIIKDKEGYSLQNSAKVLKERGYDGLIIHDLSSTDIERAVTEEGKKSLAEIYKKADAEKTAPMKVPGFQEAQRASFEAAVKKLGIALPKDISDVQLERLLDALDNQVLALNPKEQLHVLGERTDAATMKDMDVLNTPQEGMVDIGLEAPVPGERFFLDEGGQEVTFAKAMADLADDDRTAEAMRTCLL